MPKKDPSLKLDRRKFLASAAAVAGASSAVQPVKAATATPEVQQRFSGADSRSRISEFIYPFARPRRTRAGLFFLAKCAAPATAGRRGTRRRRREPRRRIRSSPARQRLQMAIGIAAE